MKEEGYIFINSGKADKLPDLEFSILTEYNLGRGMWDDQDDEKEEYIIKNAMKNIIDMTPLEELKKVFKVDIFNPNSYENIKFMQDYGKKSPTPKEELLFEKIMKVGHRPNPNKYEYSTEAEIKLIIKQ